MRADRLLALLMLLQTRGSLTASQLASELEVSERTIYRDLTALSAAGVPVYAERGPGGGCRLIEDYRTNLTGLTADEVRALFTLSIPAALDQLGMGQELRAALLKLSASLPDSRRGDERQVRQRLHLDTRPWSRADEPVPHLNRVQQALWQDHWLKVAYRSEFGTHIDQTVAPYGLVAKGNTWYLVARYRDHLRVIRVARLEETILLDETFPRPDDFDLSAFWDDWCTRYEQNLPSYLVRVRLNPDLIRFLPRFFGDQAPAIWSRLEPPDETGWQAVDLHFETFEEARSRLLGMGSAVEVLDPLPLRESVVDFAQQITLLYSLDK
jgi:predicted DNA-binding transcriptional regulator YafY